MGAIYELSKALCSLDVSEISDLVKVIHENVDITGLLNKTETVANKTINYDSYRDELILRQRQARSILKSEQTVGRFTVNHTI